MSKYIRTTYGIFEHNEKDELDGVIINDKHHVACCGNRLVSEDDVIRQADTIEELCDKFIGLEENGTPHIFAHECDLSDLIRNTERKLGTKVTGYGAIWTTGEDGEPILESVAKMNEKGDFELL